MKKLIVSLALAFSGMAAHAGPAEAVKDTVTRLIGVLNIANNAQRAAGMCQLVRARVDVGNIGQDLLGRQWIAADPAGAAKFQQLVPSIIVSEFFDRLSRVGDQTPVVNPNLVPKGSSRAGVYTQIGSTHLLITVNKASLKVYDVEYAGNSLVNSKRAQFQRAMDSFQQSGKKPIAALVDSLINSGRLVRCN